MHNHLNVTRTFRHFVKAVVPVFWRRNMRDNKLKIKKDGGDRTTPELPPEGIAIPFPTYVSIFCL